MNCPFLYIANNYLKYFPLRIITLKNICLSLQRINRNNMEPICVIKDIYKTLYQFEKDFLDAYELTINEAMLLCCLKDGECKSAGLICDFIGLSNSRVSKIITSVEDKGLINRTICKEDKRQMIFELSETGKTKVAQMMTAELQIESLFEKLTECMKRD